MRASTCLASFLVCIAGIAGIAGAAGAVAADTKVSFRDPQDGWFDLSAFLDTAYGFIPLISPITEPAVGYGAVGALVFIDRNPPAAGGAFVRPNIAVAGGLATENGTDGLFAGHLGTWKEGRLRTEFGLADADVNLQYFGLVADPAPGDAGVEYTIAAGGGIAGASYRLADRPLWLGLRYALATTEVRLRDAAVDPP